MISIFSVTDHPNYLFFIPLTAFSWNQIGVSCIIFYPERIKEDPKFKLAQSYCRPDTLFKPFSCPRDAEATYAQVSRLFAAALKELPQDEILITTDCDMMVFGDYLTKSTGMIDIFGADLLAGQEQYPICYVSAMVEQWWYFMQIEHRTYQRCIELVLENEHVNADMRGNMWARDQETLHRMIKKSGLEICIHPRANAGGFAKNRIDRDDSQWQQSIDTAHDYHMHRPGNTPDNFYKIWTVCSRRFPMEDIGWMIKYRDQYNSI
jgi:hypothetical protein